MCAIVGSFDKSKLIELIKLNSYRGSHSFSFTVIDPLYGLSLRVRDFGTIDPDIISIPEGGYGIVHVQAPTTEAKTFESIHPATDGNTLLWHNGIIKSHYVKILQSKYGHGINWDTELLLRAVNYSKDELNHIDGSFSCLWYDGSTAHLFRNDISPMFYDRELNISSTKFDGSISTVANTILRMDLQSKCLYNTGFTFRTVENPYYFGDSE